MIPGYKTIPLNVKEINKTFFSDANTAFHGDYRYNWDANTEKLTVYSRVGNILKNLGAAYIADKVNEPEIGDALIKDENKTGKKKIAIYRVNEYRRLVHVMSYFSRKGKKEIIKESHGEILNNTEDGINEESSQEKGIKDDHIKN